MIDWIHEMPPGSLAIWAAMGSFGFAWLGSIFLRPVFRMSVKLGASSPASRISQVIQSVSDALKPDTFAPKCAQTISGVQGVAPPEIKTR